MGVLTPHIRIVLPYAASISLSEAAAGAGASYSYCLNNVFDPDFTGVGAQPLGLDQYAQFYGRYRVCKLRYAVSFSNLSGTTQPIYVGLYCSPQSTLPANPMAWVIQPTPGTKVKQIAATTGGLTVHEFKGSVNLPKIFGVTAKEYFDEADFTALVSSNPARQGYLHLFVVGGAAVATARMLVRLWYTTELSQAVALGLS